MTTLPPAVVSMITLVLLLLGIQAVVAIARRQAARAVAAAVTAVLLGLVPAFVDVMAKWNPPDALVVGFAAMLPVLALAALIGLLLRAIR